jgi:myosin heavy subunit
LDIEQYNYLNQSGCTSVPTINDVEDYNRVRVRLNNECIAQLFSSLLSLSLALFFLGL